MFCPAIPFLKYLLVSFVDRCILFQDDSQNVADSNIERENGSFNSQDGSSVATGPLSVAFGFVTRLASELFARGKKHLDGSNSDAMDEVESHQSNEISESGDDIDKAEGENNVATSESTVVTTNDASGGKSVDVDMADKPGDSDGFKHFDVQQCPPDHHYLENMAQVKFYYMTCILWCC